ncbi:hypothetical protein BSQ39_07475 [Loigolactobacillus backii]|uniref:citrate/2-methylcitrate synthase n=1 Tax=Loigolactobacillus backii TaxID=375175 RepID=UPI000C1C90C9|nr:citrate/2-methylcitrate synthase [Loigolactobacillus backii]PIO83406.1 hypothetical protein BSQ39_07475 [Loigolactobacillus backii]
MTNGLAGIVAGQTSISSTNNGHLIYAGYPIEQLAKMQPNFETTMFLLWHLRLPQETELTELQQQLTHNMVLPANYLALLKQICREPEAPMSQLRTAVSLLEIISPADLTAEAIQAKVLIVITAIIRLHRGQSILTPLAKADYATNLLYLVTGKRPQPRQQLIENQVLLVHADHEFNASTFTARVTASTATDTYSCLTAAIAALKGPLHGGANEKVGLMLEELTTNKRPPVLYLKEKLKQGEKIMGFGHRIYKKSDPREKLLKKYAKELAQRTNHLDWYQTSIEIERYMWAQKHLIPNVDFYSATIYHCLGFKADEFTLLFAASRCAGWLAHIKEQRQQATLIRPSSEYIGPRHLQMMTYEANQQAK